MVISNQQVAPQGTCTALGPGTPPRLVEMRSVFLDSEVGENVIGQDRSKKDLGSTRLHSTWI